MNRPTHDPIRVDLLCRTYAAALRLYPRGHRERWGAQIQQAFRDQCRQASREESRLGPWLLRVALPDLVCSSFRERVIVLFHRPQGDPMNRIATLVSAIVLEVLGSALIAVSAIGLWNAIAGGRFGHPGAFDALTALQVAFGMAGVVLLAVGIRQFKPTAATRPA